MFKPNGQKQADFRVEKYTRFGIRKYSFGAASVAIATGLMFLGNGAVSANTTESSVKEATTSTSSESGSSSSEASSTAAPEVPTVAVSSETTEAASNALEVKEVEAPKAEVKATADKSGLQAKIAALQSAIKSADKSTDSSALAFANQAVAEATAVLNNAEATQAEVDAQVTALTQVAKVVKEASAQAKASEADKKVATAEASQPAEKTALEKTVSEAVVTNRLANNFVEKEAKEKEVAVDLTDAVKAAVANNEANITASNQVLADKEATTDALKNATQQLQSSIEAVYVSLRKAGKEEFEVALADEVNTTGLTTSQETTIREAAKGLKVGEGVGVQFDNNAVVTPGMDNANGANAEETPAPAGLVKNAEDGRFNLAFLELNWFNQANYPDDLSRKYYFRLSGSIDLENSDVKVELMEKETNTVLETHTLSQNATVNFTALQAIYPTLGVKAQGSAETAEPAKSQPIVLQYQTNTANNDSWGRINATYTREGDTLVNQIGNAVIPKVRLNNTYYRVQGDGRLLAVYSLLANTEQKISPSGVREFTGYKYVNTENNGQIFDLENSPWQMDIAPAGPQIYGVKRLVKYVKSDGSVVKSVWYKDPTYTGPTTNDADTTGYIQIIETSEMLPGEQNTNYKVLASKTSTGEDFITEAQATALQDQVNTAIAAANNGIASAVEMIVYQNPDVTNVGGTQGVTVKVGFNGQTTAPNTIAGAPLIPGRSLTITTANYANPNSAVRPLLSVVLYNDKSFAAEATHYYVPVGSVVVKYEYEDADGTRHTLSGTGKAALSDTTGTAIPTTGQTAVDNTEITSTPKNYDTTTEALRPSIIVAEDGSVYYLKELDTAKSTYNNNTETNTADDVAVDATGTVQQGLTTITYVYEKGGNVNINYIATDGTVIKQPVTDVENGKPSDAYNAAETTTDNTGEKPARITTTDGKVYKLVTAAGTTTGGTTQLTYDANGVVTATADGGSTINGNPIANQSGTVEAGVTKEVTYVYQEVKGNVAVHFIDELGNELTGTANMPGNGTETLSAGGLTAVNQAGLDTTYDTTTKKATRITTADGKVYELAGDVENGVVVAENSVQDSSDPETGSVKEETQHITYVYKEVKGNVVVKYKTTDGTQLSGNLTLDGTAETVDVNGVKVAGATDASGGVDYSTANYKPATITTADGKKYELVTVAGTTTDGTAYDAAAVATGEGNASANGKVVAGETQTVTYIYQEVKGNVVVKYETTDGTQLSGDLTFDESTTPTSVATTGQAVAGATDASGGTAYDTTSSNYKPTIITTADGKVYKLVEANNGLKDGSATAEGKVIAGETQTVTYVYEEVKGNVVVNYVDTEGNSISGKTTGIEKTSVATSENDETNASAGTAYNTRDLRPETITTDDGTVYYYKEIQTGSVDETGQVEADTTKEVTYVYEKAGSVTINYIATDGTVLQTPVKDTVNAKAGTAYDTTENTDSKEERPAVISTGGKVYRLVQTAGQTTTGVSYDENGVATGNGYYPTTGIVEAGLDKNVTYVYEEVKFGDVEVAFINTKGETVAETESVVSGEEVGTDYTTTPKETITVTNPDGTTTTYRLVTKEGATDTGVKYDANGVATGDGNAPAIGSVTENKQTVTYVYEVVQGNVIVNYEDEAGNPISGTTTGIAKDSVSTTEADTTDANVGTTYDTTDLKPTTITTADGKVYKLLPALTKGNETGEVTEGTIEVTYVYQLVTGDVDVHYVNTDGKVIAPTVKDTDDADTGSAYDTTDHKPEKIVEDSTGDVYYYKELKSGDSETGKVTEGTTDVTYIYEKAGNVVVNYVTTDGTVIKDQVNDETNAKPGSDYTTTDNKPTTITTADGKTYKLVEKNNGLQDGSAPESGTVEAGKTASITYVYEEVKGNVVVENYDTEGNKLGETTEVVPSSSTGTDYTTKPADKIEHDGKTYYYKEVKSDSEAPSGKVKEGTTTVKYVYEEAGNVVVNYVTTDGKVIKTPVNDETNAKPGSDYNTTDNKPATITTTDGKTYKLVEKNNGVHDGSAPESGKVEAGKTTEVTYVYQEIKGKVVVNYVDTDGKEISGTTTGIEKKSVSTKETDTPDANVGTTYDTTDLKPTTITTADGKVYKLLPALTKGNETGEVVEGTTEVTYVYQLQTGDVDVHYVNTDSKTIAPTVKDTDDADTGSDYNTTDHKPEKIVEDSTGDVYYYKELKSGNRETGKVTAGTTDVTYIYEKAGNVVVHYVTTDGKVIKDQVKDETNVKPGTVYNTTDNKPATITTTDGKTYKLVEKNNGVHDGSAPESGKVEVGKTTEVTYVYQEVKGNVVVKYVTTEGQILNGTLTADGSEITVPTTGIVDTPESNVDTPYNTTDHKPTTIEKDGKTYRLVPTATQGAETGKVVEGTTTVTYVYQEVKGNVVVENYDTKGNKLGKTTEVVPSSSTGIVYTTKPADKIEHDGKAYYYKEVKSDSEAPSGKVKEGTTTVKYVYEEAGNVVVNYVTTDGKVIKTPVKDETNVKPGSDYNTTDNKPATITTTDGKTYKLVEKNNGVHDGSAPESGKVEAGKTTTVTYVYQEVKAPEVKRGNVVIRYENEKGEVIKDPVNDETDVLVGTAYDTRDHKPTTITKDGKTYELVPSLTRGAETGTVEVGTTVITYVYREVVAPTPTEEKVTKFVEEGTNKKLSPEEKGTQPKKVISGYEFVKTITDESGNTIHIYRKVVTPTPQPTPNPQPTPQPEPTPVPQPEPQPKPTPMNVTPVHDAPVQPVAVVTPAQTSTPASATEKQLPNTGTENHAGLAALGLAGLLGGLGLLSRKKKEE